MHYYISYLLRDPVSRLPIGTMCIVDTNPMKALPWQRKGLQTFANQVTLTLQLRLEAQQTNALATALRENLDLLHQSMKMVEELSETNTDYLKLLMQLST